MSSSHIPVVDLAASYRAYREEIDDCVARVLASGWYILGREVAAFERAFADWLGVPEVVGVANGTDAVTLALRALGVGPGDGVLTVSHTAVATVAAIELAGAAPILVDVDPASYTIDLAKLSDTVNQLVRAAGSPRPRAVVAVHLYGHSCDIGGLRELCGRCGLELIEDCAQAHGTTWHGSRAGTFGSAAAFSFYPTKNLGAFGDAGAVAFTDSAIAKRCRALREYGWTQRYVSEYPGINSRLDELQAAILAAKLRHLDIEVAARRAVAARYDAAFSGLEGINVPSVAGRTEHSYHLYVVRCRRREDLRRELERRGVGTGIHYPVPVHRQRAYQERVLVGAGGLGVTETLAAEVLSLPMHAFLSASDVDRVIEAVHAAL